MAPGGGGEVAHKGPSSEDIEQPVHESLWWTRSDLTSGSGSVRDRMLICCALAVAHTLLIVHYSLRHGRLVDPPVADDVVYLIDGLERLRTLYAYGPSGLISGFFESPPHSPFSSVLALVSFALFGVHSWAPYLGNFVIVLVLLAFSDWVMTGTSLWQRMLCYLFVLSTRLAGNAVYDFRPDLAAGVVTAIGLIMLAFRPFLRSTVRYRVGLGTLAGAALLIKPSISPLTLALFAIAGILSLGVEIREGVGRIHGRMILLRWLPFVGSIVVLAGPYFVLSGREIARYIAGNVLGRDRVLWQFPGGSLVQARHYLDGVGGMYMLGGQLWLLSGLTVLGGILALRRRRVNRLRLGGFGVIVLVSYVVPTISAVKGLFFAVVFHALLLFSSVMAIRLLAEEGHGVNARRRLAGSLALGATALLGIWLARFPAPWADGGSEAVVMRSAIVDSIHRTISEGSPLHRAHTFVTTYGLVNADTLRFRALEAGDVWLTFSDLHRSDNLSGYAAQFALADFVVASEPGNSEVWPWLPSSQVQDQTLGLVRSDRDFTPVATFTTRSGKAYFVFKRPLRFDGWHAITGLGPLEGPYLNWGLPVVRWGLGAASVLAVDGTTEQHRLLVMRCRSPIANQTITVRIDARPIGTYSLPAAGTFYDFEVPLDLASGPHSIELAYKEWIRDDPSRPMAVLFSRLALLP